MKPRRETKSLLLKCHCCSGGVRATKQLFTNFKHGRYVTMITLCKLNGAVDVQGLDHLVLKSTCKQLRFIYMLYVELYTYVNKQHLKGFMDCACSLHFSYFCRCKVCISNIGLYTGIITNIIVLLSNDSLLNQIQALEFNEPPFRMCSTRNYPS